MKKSGIRLSAPRNLPQTLIFAQAIALAETKSRVIDDVRLAL